MAELVINPGGTKTLRLAPGEVVVVKSADGRRDVTVRVPRAWLEAKTAESPGYALAAGEGTSAAGSST
jgi:hypothetical protein